MRLNRFLQAPRAQPIASPSAASAKMLKSRAFCAHFQAFCICAKCTKFSINQMVKCAKKLINPLTKWANMQKIVSSSRRQSFGGRVCVRIMSIFSFPTHTRAYFARQITKDYKTFSMWLQNKKQTETQNALCNFSKSPHMFRLPNCMAWCIMRLVYFALYTWLVVCACLCGSLGCFMRSWLVWALSA